MCSIENVVFTIFPRQKEKKQNGAERLEEEKRNTEKMWSHFCNEEALKGLARMSAYSPSCCNTVSLEGKVTIGRNSYVILPFYFKKKKEKKKGKIYSGSVGCEETSGIRPMWDFYLFFQGGVASRRFLSVSDRGAFRHHLVSVWLKKKEKDESVTLKQVTMVTLDVFHIWAVFIISVEGSSHIKPLFYATSRIGWSVT